MAQKEKRSTLELSVLSKTSLQPPGSCKCPGNNQRGHYCGEIRRNHRDVTLWTRFVAVLVPFVWCHAQLHGTLPQSRCYGLTFRNWGVTNRTVAIRQTCSSSDDCRLRGNDSSSPLQEEVGTASEKTFSSNADHQTLRALSWNNAHHFYETWSLLQIWRTRIQASPLDQCYLWRDDSKIQYVPHLKEETCLWSQIQRFR